MDPLTVLACYDALCTEHQTVGLFIRKSLQSSLNCLSRVRTRSLCSPACEHLVSMMVVMIMIVTAAGAVRTVVMVVVMLFIMVVVVVLMVIIVVVVVMFMLFIVVMVVMLVVIIVVMVVVMMLALLCKKSLQLVVKCVLLSHCVSKLLSGELVPLGSYDRRSRVEFSQTLYSVVYLILSKTSSMAEDDTACVCDLVVEELTKILLIHLALLCVNYSCKAVKLHIVSAYVLNSTDNIAELANARGLDEDTAGMIFLQHLLQSLAEISHKTTADTAGIHLSYLDTGILQEASVYTNVTELILDKHQLFALVALVYELLDKGSLTSSKKAGENSYLCHTSALLSLGYRRINGR